MNRKGQGWAELIGLMAALIAVAIVSAIIAWVISMFGTFIWWLLFVGWMALIYGFMAGDHGSVSWRGLGGTAWIVCFLLAYILPKFGIS